MDFENIKDKITKKHIIIGTSALLIVAGGITAGVITSNSDEQPVNAPVVETQPTTEAVTTVATTTTKTTTTTKATTTTAVSTTKKPKKTEKKEDKKDSNKTEVKEDNNSYEDNNDYSYDEPQYEEPAQQETPKQEEPAPEPEPEPESEPEPAVGGLAGEWGWSGYEADLFNYALNQGCADWQADQYVWAVKTNGQDVVFIGNPVPDNPDSYFGIWIYDPSTGGYYN